MDTNDIDDDLVSAAMADVRAADAARHADVIEVLEHALSEARAGRYEAVGLVYVRSRSEVGTAFAGQPTTRADLSYAVAHLARRLIIMEDL